MAFSRAADAKFSARTQDETETQSVALSLADLDSVHEKWLRSHSTERNEGHSLRLFQWLTLPNLPIQPVVLD
jgi:hypothetical protein